MADPYVIQMTNDGEGVTNVNLGNLLVSITTKFNYSIGAWTMDITDAQGDILLAGLMLVPNVDVVYPYSEQRELIGSLVLVEQTAEDYTSDEKLGTQTALLWFPPGEPVELPG